MTSIVQSISGQFSKSLILGTFFPVATFTTLALFLLGPFVPINWPFRDPLQDLDTQSIIAVSVLTVVLTGVLFNLNIPVIRLFEGYLWQDTPLGQKRTAYYQERVKAVTDWRTRLAALRTKLSYDGSPQQAVIEEFTRLDRMLNTELPGVTPVAPTRLGNIVASFEQYAARQYGIAGVTLWPRLIGVLDKEYASSIESDKSSFDFMVNAALLSLLLALIILGAGVTFGSPLLSWGVGLLWLIEIAGFLLLAYVFYLASLGRAAAWGAMVKGSFDLYRWTLLEQIGYKEGPTTKRRERQLWEDISRQMIFGDSTIYGPWADYSSPSGFARANVYTIRLDTLRGIQRADDGRLKIMLWVKNTNTQRTAENVTVRDQPPDGFELQWGSVAINAGTVSVTGTGPYRFALGNLLQGEERTITYWVTPRVQ
jgi:hypothetical protein